MSPRTHHPTGNRYLQAVLVATAFFLAALSANASSVLLRSSSPASPELAAVKTYNGTAEAEVAPVRPAPSLTIVLLVDTMSPTASRSSRAIWWKFADLRVGEACGSPSCRTTPCARWARWLAGLAGKSLWRTSNRAPRTPGRAIGCRPGSPGRECRRTRKQVVPCAFGRGSSCAYSCHPSICLRRPVAGVYRTAVAGKLAAAVCGKQRLASPVPVCRAAPWCRVRFGTEFPGSRTPKIGSSRWSGARAAPRPASSSSPVFSRTSRAT